MTHLITLVWGSRRIFLEASALWELWNVNNPRSFCSVGAKRPFLATRISSCSFLGFEAIREPVFLALSDVSAT